MANGLSDRLDRYWIIEPEGIPRVSTGQTKRVQILKGLGNAIVPQVAYKVMKMIKDCDELRLDKITQATPGSLDLEKARAVKSMDRYTTNGHPY